MKTQRAMRALLAAGLLAFSACGGSSSSDDAAPEATPTAEIVADPTATPEPATPTIEPTAAPAEPTSTAEPDPEPAVDERDAAVIEAWERYLTLGFGSWDKEPSADSLDFASYVAGEAAIALVDGRQSYQDEGRYVTGTMASTQPAIEYDTVGDAIVDDCLNARLETLSLDDDSEAAPLYEGLFVTRVRLSEVDGEWFVVAIRIEDNECQR